MEGSPEPQTFGPSCRSQLRRVVPARFRFRVLHPFLFGCVCVFLPLLLKCYLVLLYTRCVIGFEWVFSGSLLRGFRGF